MVDLTTLLGLTEYGNYPAPPPVSTGPMKEFMIYHKLYCDVTNGGCCLEWTVPTGTSFIKFEIVGGGGPGGSSGGDHDYGIGGQGGGYGAKSLYEADDDFVSAEGSESVYTLCAAGTSDCSCCCMCNANCRHGCKSYVTGPGLTNYCAQGGMGGSTSFDVFSSCYSCMMSSIQHTTRNNYNGPWHNWICDSNYQTYGADICFTGISGGAGTDYDCCDNYLSWAGSPTGPFSVGAMTGAKRSNCFGATSCCMANSNFPGGGGTGTGTATSTGCWGSFGAGGLVKVTYQ